MQPIESALIAQRIEQRFPKPCVGCSNHLKGAKPALLGAGFLRLQESKKTADTTHLIETGDTFLSDIMVDE